MPPASLLGSFTDLATAAPEIALMAGAAPNGWAVLSFTMQPQQQTNWCWAAVASSVCGYYAALGSGAAKSQCEIATEFLGMQCCITPLPPPTANWPGNKQFTLEVPLDTLGHFAAPILQGPIDLTDIAREIDAGRPVLCHIDWGGSQGHFVAIIGYDQIHNEVIVRDPAGTIVNGALPFARGSTFPGGKWTETYLTS